MENLKINLSSYISSIANILRATWDCLLCYKLC